MRFLMNRIIVLFILSILLGCSKDDDSQTSESNIDSEIIDENLEGAQNIFLATGIQLRQSRNDAPLKYGNPNIKMNGVVVSPNPVIGNFMIETINLDNINSVWILKAKPEKKYQNENFEEILKTVSYKDNVLDDAAQLSVKNLTANNVLVNVEDLEAGYYRVFIKVGESLNWDNIHINGEGADSLEEIASPWE